MKEFDSGEVRDFGHHDLTPSRAVDMVSRLHNNVSDRQTHACGRDGREKRGVCHLMPIQRRADPLLSFAAFGEMDSIGDPGDLVRSGVLLPLVLHDFRGVRTQTERIQRLLPQHGPRLSDERDKADP